MTGRVRPGEQRGTRGPPRDALPEALAALLTPPVYREHPAHWNALRGAAAHALAQLVEAATGVAVVVVPFGGPEDAEVLLCPHVRHPGERIDDDRILQVATWLGAQLRVHRPWAVVRVTRRPLSGSGPPRRRIWITRTAAPPPAPLQNDDPHGSV